jgi:hypothetical protein
MTNQWIEHLKNYSKMNNMSYSEALKCPKCRAEYNLKVGSGSKSSGYIRKLIAMKQQQKNDGKLNYNTLDYNRINNDPSKDILKRREQQNNNKKEIRKLNDDEFFQLLFTTSFNDTKEILKKMGYNLKGLENNIMKRAQQLNNNFDKEQKQQFYELTQVKNGGSIVPSKVSNYISTVFNGRNDLPPSVRNLLDKKGDKIIKSISIGRTPVQSILTGALSAFSGGKFGKRIYKNFDELFHLYIKITLDDNNIYALEKNAVISLTKYQYRNNEEVEPVYNIPSGLTLNKMLENTKNYMGSNFLSYSAVNNNCQDFIVAVFKSNNIGDAKNIEFIKQDTEKLFKKLPVLQKIANFTTDLGAKVDEIAYGAGIKLLF